jgi:hypothetical protein
MAKLLRFGGPSINMTDGGVPPLVLGEGSSKSVKIAPSAIQGHLLALGDPQATAAVVADIVSWTMRLGAGCLVLDLDGRLAALLSEKADKGTLAPVELRVLTPSSTNGIPVAFKPLSGLSSAPHTAPWRDLRGWLPSLLAILAGMGPNTPDFERISDYFTRLLDAAKERNPSILTVQTLVAEIREELGESPEPLTEEVAKALLEDLASLAEDLRNAALAYGAPVSLQHLLETPLHGGQPEAAAIQPHIDLVLLDHMKSVADKNALISAILLEVYAWTSLGPDVGKLLLVLPEVESPTTFISTRPFAQRLAVRIFNSSQGTGLLGMILPTSLEDPRGLPRFGGILIEKAEMEARGAEVEALLHDQGVGPSDWSRMQLLRPSEWAMASGAQWEKWYRFTPNPEALMERKLDPDVLQRLLPPEVRDVFRHVPEEEEEEAEGEEGTKEEKVTEKAQEEARAAKAVEDAEDLLSYTTEPKVRRTDSKIHQEVQELLKRKLEEKERAKEAQKYELKEIDLVGGEEPAEVEAPEPPERKPITGGVIDDTRGQPPTTESLSVELHADDLQRELDEMEQRERQTVADEPEITVPAEADEWEGLTPEQALTAEPTEEEPREARPEDEEEEEEEEDIVVDLDDK